MDKLKKDGSKYSALTDVLCAAMAQASSGKGAERHGNDERWEDQRWARISNAVGDGFLLGQAIKKIEESQGMLEPHRVERELLGAINYIAMAIHNTNNRG